jgi:hypothetical protein
MCIAPHRATGRVDYRYHKIDPLGWSQQFLPAVVTDPAKIPDVVCWRLNCLIDLGSDFGMPYIRHEQIYMKSILRR